MSIGTSFLRFLQSAAARIPLALQLSLGRTLGKSLLKRNPDRRNIALRNLELCFPELEERERNALLNRHASALGEGLFEAGVAWHASARRLKSLCEVSGLETLDAAIKRGRGVLLVCGHFSNIEISVQSIAVHRPIVGIWRPLGRPRADALTQRGRMNHMLGLMEKSDVRSALKHLRKGGVLTMAFDQADTTSSAVVAPFFGHPVTCVNTPARLAQSLGCAVIPFYARYASGRYRTQIGPEFAGFADQSEEDAAGILNQALEQQIRQQPERYYWVHRRFKQTLPDCYDH